jgi:prepilin-type N-terminal cleavage/methylation domain-containing protein
MRKGFTLVELMVVILIILVVTVIALGTVIPALAGRTAAEASRILQAAVAGAKDTAMRTGQPAGVRLLPDPTFTGVNPSTGMLDPSLPLAYNRLIPLEAAPSYQEGMVNVVQDAVTPFQNQPAWSVGSAAYPYPGVRDTGDWTHSPRYGSSCLTGIRIGFGTSESATSCRWAAPDTPSSGQWPTGNCSATPS